MSFDYEHWQALNQEAKTNEKEQDLDWSLDSLGVEIVRLTASIKEFAHDESLSMQFVGLLNEYEKLYSELLCRKKMGEI